MNNPEGGFTNQDDSAKGFDNKFVLPREHLINTAVTFLTNNKIHNQDSNILRSFLKKKGLTEEETDIAFKRQNEWKNLHLPPVDKTTIPQQYPLGPLAYPVPVSSRWQSINNIVTTITSIGGILYAIYWLWKTYISPYLFGSKPKRKPVEASLAELEAAVGTCTAEVKTIQTSLENLAEQRVTELTNGVIVSRIQEVKAEVNSLKALLLNRNQFPAIPPTVGAGPPSIPTWQLSAEQTHHADGTTEEREHEDEGEGSNGTTNGSDSSLEIVKDPNN